MDLGLAGKVVVIAGSSRGIGESIGRAVLAVVEGGHARGWA